MDNSLDIAIEKALALPCWRAPTNPRPLTGGITNINLLVSDGGRDFVVRLGNDIPEHGVMRFNELAIAKAAHAAGISPAIHYSQPGAMVLDFVDAAPLSESDVQRPDILVLVVELMGRVHREVVLHLRGPVLTFWVFHILRDYSKTLGELGSPYLNKLPALLPQAENLEAAIGPVDLVLSHNDMLPANILQGTDRLWLIDWEYGGFNSPLFDLAGLASNNSLDVDGENQMLGVYFDKAPDEQLLYRYTAMKCASLLRETMWSMVSEMTSEIDFDYADYTVTNLVRYEHAYDDFLSFRRPK